MDKATQAEIDLGRERLKMHEKRAQDARDTDAANKAVGVQSPPDNTSFAKDYTAGANVQTGGVLMENPTPSFIRLESENEEEAEARKNAELAKAEAAAKAEAEVKDTKPAKKKEEPVKKKEEPAKPEDSGENLLDDLLNS